MTIEIDFVKVQSTDVGSNASVVTLQVLGFGSSNNDSAAEQVPSIELVQQAGFACRPALTQNTEAVVIRRGDEVIALFILDKSAQNSGNPALANIQQGEARMYGVGAHPEAQISIPSDGGIVATPASGKDVSLNVAEGAGQKVARVTDPVNIGYLAGTAGPYPLNLVFTVAAAADPQATPSSGAMVGLNAVIATRGGAPNVKA